VARETVEPEISTGVSSATGVSTPVRPTWMVMSLSSGFLLLGQELVGGGPARGARGGPELLAFGAVEHLDDRAVGAVVEVVAVAVDAGDGCQHFIELAALMSGWLRGMASV
jgi:hypothetical protein